MAGLGGSDYIQQQLLDQSIAMNDNLSAMRAILLDIESNTKTGGSGGGSGGGGNGPGRRNNRNGGNNSQNPFKDAFKNLFGEASNIGRTILGNNGTIQNTVGAFTVSAGVLRNSLSSLPGPVGLAANAFLSIVEVGGKVYEYLNDQLNMYNQINSAGITLADGMLTVRKGSGAAFMSINEFSTAISKNSDALAAMEGQYGDGVQHFGQLLNTVQLAQEQLGLYGVSAQQLADITAKNYKFEKMYSGQQQIRNMNETQSTSQFVQQMTYLSKTVGKSVDELIAKFSNMGDNLDSNTAIDALRNNFGMSEDKAADVTKSMNSIFASMGAAGETLQKLNASKLADNMLPEEFNNQFTQLYTDKLKELQAAGITDEKVLRKAMSQYVKEHEDQLQTEIQAQRRIGNFTAAQWLSQLKNIERTLNDPKSQPSPIIEAFTNKFNLWIGKTFTEPFNKFYTETAESAAQYLLDLSNSSTGFWDFTAKLLRDGLKQLPSVFVNGFAYLQSLLDGWAKSLFGDSYDNINNALNTFINNLSTLPQRLWDSVMGWWNSSSDEKSEDAKGAISSLYDSIINGFNYLTELDFSMDDMKKSFMDTFNTLKNKLSESWNSFVSWWNDEETPGKKTEPEKTAKNTPTPSASQPKTAGVQKVTAPPEYTKPVPIEQADQTSPVEQQTAQNSQNDAVSKLLSGILNNLETQGQMNGQVAILLRQIAENTEPPRNV